jgi:hypothetical protein
MAVAARCCALWSKTGELPNVKLQISAMPARGGRCGTGRC